MGRSEAGRNGLGRLRRREHLVAGVALLLAAGFALTLPGFASWGNVMVMLRNVSVLGVFGLGMAVVVIGRGIDLSQAAIALVATGIAAKLVVGGFGVALPVLAGFALALALGLGNGALIAYAGVPALFATLASAMLFIGAARSTLLRAATIHLPADDPALSALGARWAGVPVPILVFAAAAALLSLFLSRSRAGRFIYAHGDNPDAARLGGIDIGRLTLVEYAISASFGYLAGLIMASSTAIVDLQGGNSTLIFDVILVVVLGGVSLSGGRGGVSSVAAGTLLVGVLLDGLTIMNVNDELQAIAKGLVLLATIVADRRLEADDDEALQQGV